MGRLLQSPQIFGQPGHGRGRIENHFRAIESQLPRPLRKMAVITNIDADLRVLGVEDRVAEVSGSEVILLPESGRGVRNVILAIFAQVGAVGIDHAGCVVVDACVFLFIDGDDDDHLVFAGVLLHQFGRRSVREAA